MLKKGLTDLWYVNGGFDIVIPSWSPWDHHGIMELFKTFKYYLDENKSQVCTKTGGLNNFDNVTPYIIPFWNSR